MTKETEVKVLELLQNNRSQNEISKRTGASLEEIVNFSVICRQQGLLSDFKREGMELTRKAKSLSNGYYKSIRKRFASMKWTDKLEKREFGFKSSLESIHYYLDELGNPRVCAYCGSIPPESKVWGLDRLDSSIGHIPGNLVPCCSNTIESRILSCQTSKSNFNLFNWMSINMSRAYGKQLPKEVVELRLKEVYELAAKLSNTVTN